MICSDIQHKYDSWYFKIVSNFSNFTRLTAREIMDNNFEISFVVFMPNITTNHAITYTNNNGNFLVPDQRENATLFPTAAIFYKIYFYILLSTTVQPWYNEGPTDWQNVFAITRILFIEVLFHIFSYQQGEECRSLYRGLHSIMFFIWTFHCIALLGVICCISAKN